MSLIPPIFLNCVVAIGNKNSPTDISWVASGFFYGSKMEEPPEGWDESGPRVWLWLVTNRHVIKGLTNPVLRIDSHSGNALQLDISVTDGTGNQLWISHPDEDVDVSITPISSDFLTQIGANFEFFQHELTTATLAELKVLGVSEGQGGFLLGFPMGMVSGPTNAVIVRKSCIAKIRDTYEGNSKSILIDGIVFPGNSGGPAIIHPELVAISGTKTLNRALLIGIVAGYVSYTDVAVSPQTGRPRISFEENSGLTHVFPVDFIDQTAAYAHTLRIRSKEQANVPASVSSPE